DANPPAHVQAVVAMSPPTDPEGLISDDSGTPPDCKDNKKCTSFWRLPLVENFVGCKPADCPTSYDEVPLLVRAGPSTVPIWFSNSTDELVGLPQATTFDAALTKARVEHHYEQ